MDRSDKEVTEVTFEVTIRHYVTDGDPNPTTLDVEEGLTDYLTPPFDLEYVRAVRI